ncbi:MAG: hypothetical protein AAGH15_17395 [Myxococcota bacterium]
MKRLGAMGLALALLAGCSDDGSGGGGGGALGNVEAMLFVKRAFLRDDGTENVTGGNGQTIDYLRYEPGGGLFVLSPPTPRGRLTNLTEEFEGVDVNGVDLSFDGTQAVFSMRRAGDAHYHIYLTNVDGSTTPRQLTFGMHHDVKPIFVPGDRIAFVTNQPFTEMGTRADEYNHSRVVTQIATISIAGGDADRRLCSQNLSHSADPFLLSTGEIGYSRWEHLGPVNDVKLFRMNSDCTNMQGLAGSGGKPANSLVQMHEIELGRLVGVATSRRGTIQAGAIVEIDVRAEGGLGDIVFDEQNARFTRLTPQVPLGEEAPPSGVGRYRRPFPLEDGRFLVSWSDGDVNERNELAETAPNFGVYRFDPVTRERELIYDDPDFWDVYAIPVRARDTPPVRGGTIGPIAEDDYTPAVLGSIDITQTSLPERVSGAQFDGTPLGEALEQATKVRIIEGFSSEIGPVREFGLTLHEGAAIVGEARVYDDGSWEAAVPARIPFHLQPLDRYGLAIRNQMTWIQGMPGESRRCGGCHEDRTEQILPPTGGTIAQQAGAEDFNVAIPDRRELPWAGAVSGESIQDVLDRNCVGCHDGGANDPFAGRTYQVMATTDEGEELEFNVPYLLLTDEPIEVFFEMDVVSYPASYVSLLYPSAMMGEVTATGDMPPEWVNPGSARRSRLIEVLNVNAEDDANAWAWETPAHPENVPEFEGSVSREDRLRLVEMADLGGQYWSRRNVEGADQWEERTYD